MLEIKNLTFSYDGQNNILEDINIKVDKNSIVSIIGESGIGKTTIFNLIAGILKPNNGTILINNEITDPKGYISYMLQKDLLFEHKTVLDNVALPLIIKKINKKTARQQASEILSEFNLLNVKDKYPSELSGGMRQRIALLRTYMFKKDIILLDEAFSALDTITRRDIHLWYLNISNKLNISTLLITHDIDEAIILSDTIYVLKNKPANVALKVDINFKNFQYPISKKDLSNIIVGTEYNNIKRKILEALN